MVKLQRVYARMTWLGEAMKDGVSTDMLSGSRKQALIREIPNGATHRGLYSDISALNTIGVGKRTRRIETSKYPEEKKSQRFP